MNSELNAMRTVVAQQQTAIPGSHEENKDDNNTNAGVPNNKLHTESLTNSQNPPNQSQAANVNFRVTPEDRSRVVGEQQQRILLLRHASKCPCLDGAECKVTPICSKMKILWSHIQRCRKESCSFPQCVSSQNVLAHFKGCKNLRCPLCGPILVVARRTDVVASNQLPSPKEVNHFVSTGLVPQPRRDDTPPRKATPPRKESSQDVSSSNDVPSSSSSSQVAGQDLSSSAASELSGDFKGKSYKKRMFSRDELEKSKYSYSKIHCSDSASVPRPPPPPPVVTRLAYVADPQLSESSTAAAKSVLKKTWRVSNLGPHPWPQSIMFAFAAGDRLEFLSNASWAAVTPGEPAGDRYFSVHLRVPEVSGSHITLFTLLSHGSLQIEWTGRRMKLQLTVTGGEAPQTGGRMDALDLLARAASAAEADLEEQDQEAAGVPVEKEAAKKEEDGEEDQGEVESKDDSRRSSLSPGPSPLRDEPEAPEEEEEEEGQENSQRPAEEEQGRSRGRHKSKPSSRVSFLL
mmetsp:Transcript_5569/g.8264  ORF Transcript_5569/g.8264 Transcript_5569/m.8264 type:complete len:517 (+) Transcript_5569:125-1675(+)